jgi:hypothetical protein
MLSFSRSKIAAGVRGALKRPGITFGSPMELFLMWADPAQSLFRHWIIWANCCRLGGTKAIVLLTIPVQTFPLLWHMRCGSLVERCRLIAAPAAEAIIAAIAVV